MLDDSGLAGAGEAQERALGLMLPSSPYGPQASPQLLRSEGAAADRRALDLIPWEIPALGLDVDAALDLLLGLTASAPRGVAVGDSLRFLAEAGKLALELLARGRVLPALVREDDAWVARWQPLTDEAQDAERVALLAHAMPALLRADTRLEPSHGTAAQEVLTDLLGVVVDSCARRFLAAGVGPHQRMCHPPRAGALAEAWIAALSGPDPLVVGDSRELAALAERLEQWRLEREQYAAQRMFRTCFRLSLANECAAPVSLGRDAPAIEEARQDAADRDPGVQAGWRVEILLQAKDDPTVLVPAAEVWRSNGNGLRLLGHRLEHPQERLLGGLGHALRLWPGLEPALREAAPVEVALTTESAYRFVRDAVPALEAGGFAVLAPTLLSSRLKIQLKARPKDGKEWEQGSNLFGIDGLCDYEWQIAVGEVRLTATELRELAALKLPLVRARGQWIVLRPEDIETALAFFEQTPERGEASAGELVRAGLGLDRAASGLEVAEIEAHGWLKELLGDSGERKLNAIGTPAALAGELRPYQERGLAWLAFLSSLGLGACLADDMGLGKTVQMLALLLAEREPPSSARRKIGPTLLVCPMSVLGNWQREAERFAPSLRTHVHHGRERLAGRALVRAARASDLVLTTYAIAARDRELLAKIKWERVTLDEAQNIKTSTAKQTKAIRGLPARHRVALTGTPVENRLVELHSIMDFLNPGLLGPEKRFREEFAKPIERWRDPRATQRLRRATEPFILRRLKTDRSIISDLPEKIEMRVDCHLTREQATLYQAVVDEMLEEAAVATGIERQGIILGALMKLKQVCNHPAHLLKDQSALEGRSGKLERLEEILREALAESDRALVFTQFAQFGHALRGHLQARLGREVLFLHGATSRQARDEMVARFQSPTGPAVFVLSLKAGGTGLNLTAASHVIHFDRWWNPAVEDQATDRAFRIGQHKNVQVRKLTCVGTLEERIDRLIAQKKDLAERIVGSGETWLTELDTAQLRELVTLSTDAVAVH
ncbi:MAG TPA: DEAD/DEAH box helicase [Solirubrobacteraceae bacterium]|nr:DEAD/DEAH box helicase [Solirubrobacteraceae bacterium]